MVLQGPGSVLWGCGLCSHGSVVPGDVSHPEPHCATVRVALGDVCVCGSGVPRMCTCVASDAGAAAWEQW